MAGLERWMHDMGYEVPGVSKGAHHAGVDPLRNVLLNLAVGPRTNQNKYYT